MYVCMYVCKYVYLYHFTKLEYISLLKEKSLIYRRVILSNYNTVENIYSKTPLDKMTGIALKGQCDLISIMVLPRVSIKEKFP